MNRGLLSQPRCGGMSLGRLVVALYFGVGKRLRIPRRAIAVHIDDPTAQMRKVQRSPILSRSAFSMKGNTKPPTPAPEKMIPPARPRRSENHSGSSFRTGMYRSPPAMPTPTPWRRISCHTYPPRFIKAVLGRCMRHEPEWQSLRRRERRSKEPTRTTSLCGRSPDTSLVGTIGRRPTTRVSMNGEQRTLVPWYPPRYTEVRGQLCQQLLSPLLRSC